MENKYGLKKIDHNLVVEKDGSNHKVFKGKKHIANITMSSYQIFDSMPSTLTNDDIEVVRCLSAQLKSGMEIV